MNMFVLGQLISDTHGAGLVVDYGEKHPFSDSLIVKIKFQGIYKHKYVPKDLLLQMPGLIDLSYYVDFYNLEKAAKSSNSRIQTNIITQGDFLKQMYIQDRGNMLKENSKENADLIDLQIKRLIDDEYMGRIYKFMSYGNESYYPFIN